MNGYPPRPVPHKDDYPRVPPRDSRYDYPPPPAPAREYRRPPSPRDYRDYGPPSSARARDYDDYRGGQPALTERDRYPPPAADYRSRYPPVADPMYRGYPPPQNPDYERYDRRPSERAPAYPPSYRPRSPPRARDEYDRAPRFVHCLVDICLSLIFLSSDYPEYRSRPVSPRYADYGRVGAEPTGRYRFERSFVFL